MDICGQSKTKATLENLKVITIIYVLVLTHSLQARIVRQATAHHHSFCILANRFLDYGIRKNTGLLSFCKLFRLRKKLHLSVCVAYVDLTKFTIRLVDN
jgi:hypothetical protein